MVDTQPDSDIGLLLTAARQALGQGNALKAIEFYTAVLKCRPNHSEALQQLAWISEAAGDLDRMAELLERRAKACPEDPKAHQDLGLCLMRLGKREDGVAHLRQTTALAPEYATGHCNLGLALEDRGDFAGASDALRQALRLDPHSAFIAYHLSAVNAQAGRPFAAPPACPREYLVKLFDDYAVRFDQHLFQSLKYRGPLLLADIVAEAGGNNPPKPWNILDLGCGTGMTALPFRESARSIVGVDLAPRMLQYAEQRATKAGKKVYDELIESDLVPAMGDRPEKFDLILAADVFIYIGDLSAVFSAAHSALRPGGLFAFTTEIWDGHEDYRLLPSRRYAQSPRYIEELTRRTGFSEVSRRQGPLRMGEDQQPVIGGIFLLRRENSSSRGG